VLSGLGNLANAWSTHRANHVMRLEHVCAPIMWCEVPSEARSRDDGRAILHLSGRSVYTIEMPECNLARHFLSDGSESACYRWNTGTAYASRFAGYWGLWSCKATVDDPHSTDGLVSTVLRETSPIALAVHFSSFSHAGSDDTRMRKN
jgi:hypothetical protein